MLIFSKYKKKTLLFSYHKFDKKSDQREDITPPETFLQCSFLSKDQGFTINPHYHKSNNRLSKKTNEAWIVIRGELQADLYDLNNTKIETLFLKKGSCLIMHNGGHALKVTKKNTLFYEIKNGPYDKEINDKVII